ncbi:MAG: NUDIX domain-containing protein [Clostridia bacterium]|nr:NUDIX domain-containing protein [Clostridia bacterium]
MSKELEFYQQAERSINKKYRKQLWNPFVEAVKNYELIKPGDRIAVCISGGKDSMLMAKLMQMLERYSEIPFELEYLVMDPGYSPENREKIEDNAKKLNIPVRIFESDIFEIANSVAKTPCYLCARMRRGHLYAKAKELGCNKIALGHHFNDVIETTVMAMLYGAQLQAMLPKLHSSNFEGMELIRPLYCVREDDIIAWAKHNGLDFIRCACRFTEGASKNELESKRLYVKRLIKKLCEDDPTVEKNIFNSIHGVCLDTFPAYKSGGELHSFLDNYDGAKKRVSVAAALIRREDTFLICQRPENKARGLLWEFVGGKREPGETLEETLVRECREELGVTVRPLGVFMSLTHEYPDLTVDLTVFNAGITDGEPKKLEHNDLKWIRKDEIGSYDFCPADKTILEKIKNDG